MPHSCPSLSIITYHFTTFEVYIPISRPIAFKLRDFEILFKCHSARNLNMTIQTLKNNYIPRKETMLCPIRFLLFIFISKLICFFCLLECGAKFEFLIGL